MVNAYLAGAVPVSWGGVGVHASFELAGSADAPPRESIEARVVCFWFARDESAWAAPPEL